jgi:hypothetical protein
VREKYCWLVADKPSEQGEVIVILFSYPDTSMVSQWKQLTLACKTMDSIAPLHGASKGKERERASIKEKCAALSIASCY